MPIIEPQTCGCCAECGCEISSQRQIEHPLTDVCDEHAEKSCDMPEPGECCDGCDGEGC